MAAEAEEDKGEVSPTLSSGVVGEGLKDLVVLPKGLLLPAALARVVEAVGVSVEVLLLVPLPVLLVLALPPAAPPPLLLATSERVEEGVGVPEGEAPVLREEVGEEDRVPLPVPLPVAVGVGVVVPVPVGLADKLGLWDVLGVMDGEAPVLRVALLDTSKVGELVGVGVELPVGVGVGDPVGLPVGTGDAVPVLDVLGLEVPEGGVALGEAPLDRLAVGVTVTVLLPLAVEVGLTAPLPVPVLLGVPLTVLVGVPVGLLLGV